MIGHSLRMGVMTVALAGLAAGGLAGVSGCNPVNADTVTITEQNADSTITLQTGQMLRVMLASNPSTGYAWDPTAFDTSILEQQRGIEFIPSNPALTGAGGTSCITFQAAQAGRTTLRLAYHRSFGADTSATETFAVTVVVSAG